jgi:hypothetical protein
LLVSFGEGELASVREGRGEGVGIRRRRREEAVMRIVGAED